MIQLKLILAIIKKNMYTNIGLACLYSFLFIAFFGIICGYFFLQNIFKETYGENILEITSVQKTDEHALDYKFVDAFTASFPGKKIYPNFLVRIPTMMEISFFGKALETDTFLMGYSTDYMKAYGYEMLGEPEESGDIGLSISNETLLLLKNLVFSDLSKDTLKYFSGTLVFGESSMFGKISSQSYTKRFYIEGISNSLPIYAIAMDIDKAIVMLEEFGVQKKDIKLHTVHVGFDSQEEKKEYHQFIESYNAKYFRSYKMVDSGKQTREVKEKYKHIFYIILGIASVFFLICILVMTELSLQNLMYKTKNIIQVAWYSQIPKQKILFLFFGVFISILLMVGILLSVFIVVIHVLSQYIFAYIGQYSVFFQSAYVSSIVYFFVFLLLFICYYIVSLAIKIYRMRL